MINSSLVGCGQRLLRGATRFSRAKISRYALPLLFSPVQIYTFRRVNSLKAK
jgi:hypothetical protein